MAGLITNTITNTRMQLATWLAPKKALTNAFNQAFYSLVGGGWTAYDSSAKTYIEKGYNENPDVYAIVSQIARKFSSVPGVLKEVKDKKAKKELKRLYGQSLTPQEVLRKSKLEIKAFNEDLEEIEEPLERPNYYQSETEFKALWETFMLLTGNAYQWILSPEDGANAGRPMERFLLPAHYVQIVLKKDYNLNSLESPIDHYILMMGNSFIRFEAKDIIHSKFPNPNYDLAGRHLYGQSPLEAAKRDIQLSNKTIDHSIATVTNGGVYGFIHAADGQTPLTVDQAMDVKARLVEMEASKETLGRIKGASAPLAFTKLSLDTDEMQPHSFSSASQKRIANCLGWSDKLLNNDQGAKYDNFDGAWVQSISNRITPDLAIYADDLNAHYYPRFKELKNAEVHFDVSELPEMQGDMKALAEWMATALENGAINPDEFRIALRYPATGMHEMQKHYLKQGVVPIEEAGLSSAEDRAFNLE